MNKRIEQLSLKAMSMVMNGDDPNGDVDRMYIPAEFAKTFAALVVGECAGIYDMIDNGNLHMGTDDYLKALRKTFKS